MNFCPVWGEFLKWSLHYKIFLFSFCNTSDDQHDKYFANCEFKLLLLLNCGKKALIFDQTYIQGLKLKVEKRFDRYSYKVLY